MKKTASSIKLILRDLQFVDSFQPGVVWLQILGGLLEGGTPFVGIYSSSLIVNGITQKLALQTLLLYACLAVGLTLLISRFKATVTKLQQMYWQKMRYTLDLKIALKMSQVDYSNLENPDTYQLLRSLQEMENLGSGFKCIGNAFRPAIQGLSTMILAGAVAYQVFTATDTSLSGLVGIVCAPWSAIIVIGCMVGSVLANIWANKGVFYATRMYLGKSRAFTNRLLYYTADYVHGYAAGKDIRLYGQKKIIGRELFSMVRQKNKDNDYCENQSIGYQGIGILASGFLTVLVYLYVVIKSFAGLFRVGDIVRYVGGIMQFASGLTVFLDSYTQLKANTQFMDVYYQLFNLPATLYTGGALVPAHEPMDIEFQNVSFRYPGNDTYALKQFSCTLKAGKHYAIVGLNGSGKTTVIKLLCRLYDPEEGRILLGGKDIREYDYDQYRAVFAVVFQDFQLFPFALGQNVSARETYDGQRVRRVLKQSGFEARLAALPEGCATVLYQDFTTNGIEVSNGEAQKIALARALYKDAPVIVLDEPTAALDPMAERELYLSLHDIGVNKTVVYISHRLASCKFCDEIIVIHQGALIQRGNHEDLLIQRNGQYYMMWEAQARHYAQTNFEKQYSE